jgi:hypothetical protein
LYYGKSKIATCFGYPEAAIIRPYVAEMLKGSYVSVCNLLSPLSRVLLGKLTDPNLVKKLFAFYETRRFITAFTSARHLSLS